MNPTLPWLAGLIALLVGLAVASWPRGSDGAAHSVLRHPRGDGMEATDSEGTGSEATGTEATGMEATGMEATGMEVGTVGDVAATCDLLALALRAGAGLETTLTEVAAASEAPVAVALDALVAARRWGIDPEASGVGGEAWAPLVRALRLADSAGVPPAGSIRAVAADLREGRQHRLEVATSRLRVQVVLPLGLCFLPAFVLTTVVPVVLALAARVAGP